MIVLTAFVRHQRGLAADLRNQDRAQRLAAHFWHMKRTHLAAALDQSKGGLLAHSADVLFVALADVLVRLLAADVGFVRLDDLAFAAFRAALVSGACLRGCDAP